MDLIILLLIGNNDMQRDQGIQELCTHTNMVFFSRGSVIWRDNVHYLYLDILFVFENWVVVLIYMKIKELGILGIFWCPLPQCLLFLPCLRRLKGLEGEGGN